MNCQRCGKCRETLDDNEICDSCRNLGTGLDALTVIGVAIIACLFWLLVCSDPLPNETELDIHGVPCTISLECQ